MPRRAWLVVGLLWLVVCFNFMNRVMLTTMHGSLVHSLGLNETRFGLLTSIFLWSYGLSSPFAGFLSDRFGRSRMIILTLFVWSAITALSALARTFSELMAMRALVGICEACYLPAALALISEYHRGPTRSFATGVHLTGMVAGSAVGGLGGWAAEHFGWPATFGIVGLSGILYCGPLLFLLRDAPGDPEPAAGGPAKVRFGPAVADLLGQGGYLLAIAYWGILGAMSWSVTGWMPVYLQEHFHLSQGAAGIDSSDFATFGGLAGMLAGGAWADRWSRRDRRGPILVPIVGLIAAAPALVFAVHTSLLPVAIGGIVLIALCGGFANSNMMPILCLITNPRYRATAYGISNMTGTVAGGLAIFAAGALRDARIDLRTTFNCGAGEMVLCIVLLLLLFRRVPSAPDWLKKGAAASALPPTAPSIETKPTP